MKPLSSSGNVSSQVCGYKNRISLPDRDFFLTLFFVPDVASINHKLKQIKDNKTATCYMPCSSVLTQCTDEVFGG